VTPGQLVQGEKDCLAPRMIPAGLSGGRRRFAAMRRRQLLNGN
jgi:hypothetical protein